LTGFLSIFGSINTLAVASVIPRFRRQSLMLMESILSAVFMMCLIDLDIKYMINYIQ